MDQFMMGSGLKGEWKDLVGTHGLMAVIMKETIREVKNTGRGNYFFGAVINTTMGFGLEEKQRLCQLLISHLKPVHSLF